MALTPANGGGLPNFYYYSSLKFEKFQKMATFVYKNIVIMQKEEIIHLIDRNYNEFISFVGAQPAQDFSAAPEGKWSSGQHCAHLTKAVKPVRLGLTLPKFVPSLLFGKSNRPSKTYQELVLKYQQKLAEGGKASAPFIPRIIKSTEQKKVTLELLTQKERLLRTLNRWSEKDLDTYIIPHPILGKLTVREMLYFTAYHANHHLNSIKSFYK
jgi:hypothetical protein